MFFVCSLVAKQRWQGRNAEALSLNPTKMLLAGLSADTVVKVPYTNWTSPSMSNL